MFAAAGLKQVFGYEERAETKFTGEFFKLVVSGGEKNDPFGGTRNGTSGAKIKILRSPTHLNKPP